MVLEELDILVSSSGYSAEFIKKSPVYVRRKLLDFLKKRLEAEKQAHEKAMNKK